MVSSYRYGYGYNEYDYYGSAQRGYYSRLLSDFAARGQALENRLDGYEEIEYDLNADIQKHKTNQAKGRAMREKESKPAPLPKAGPDEGAYLDGHKGLANHYNRQANKVGWLYGKTAPKPKAKIPASKAGLGQDQIDHANRHRA